MMRCGLFGIGGVFTPLHGCRKVTLSFNAVVKIALRTTMQYLMAWPDALSGKPGHPFTHVGRENFHHSHRPELGNDPAVKIVDVILAGPQLHHMGGKPPVPDVALEGLPPAPWVARSALSYLGFLALPGLIGLLPAGEGAGRALAAVDVPVVGRVPALAVQAGPHPGIPHRLPLI